MGGSRISAAAGRARTSLLGAFIVPINQARISSDRRSSDVQIVIRRWLSFINLFGSESASGSDSCTPQIPVRSAVNGAKHYAAGSGGRLVSLWITRSVGVQNVLTTGVVASAPTEHY